MGLIIPAPFAQSGVIPYRRSPAARYRVEEITAPTLVVHAKDDRLNPFSFGEYTAQHIPGAQFLPLASGGHLLLGQHAEVRARVNAFLRQQAAAGQP